MNIGAPVLVEDFLQFGVQHGRREKSWNGRTEGVCGNQFCWRESWIHGPEPASEAEPDFSGVVQRQVLKQSLSDASQLNMDVECSHLAADRGAVSVAGPM